MSAVLSMRILGGVLVSTRSAVEAIASRTDSMRILPIVVRAFSMSSTLREGSPLGAPYLIISQKELLGLLQVERITPQKAYDTLCKKIGPDLVDDARLKRFIKENLYTILSEKDIEYINSGIVRYFKFLKESQELSVILRRIASAYPGDPCSNYLNAIARALDPPDPNSIPMV